MDEARRRAYLDAMGIPLWTRRGTQAGSDTRSDQPTGAGLRVCPGIGSVLMVCADRDDTASPLANDISRAMGNEPVWAWPETAGEGDTDVLENVVAERLFTEVLIFGGALSDALFGDTAPETIGAARILNAASIKELTERSGARRQLWGLMRDNLLVHSA